MLDRFITIWEPFVSYLKNNKVNDGIVIGYAE